MDITTNFLAPGRSLPTNVHLIERMRDVVILDLPSLATKPPTYTRTAVILDQRADPRMFEILFALHYRNLAIRVNLLAIAKVKGRLRWWYGDPATIDTARRPMIEACDAAFWPTDRIDTEPGILVPVKGGRLDRDSLPASEALLRVVPEQFKLGLVQP